MEKKMKYEASYAGYVYKKPPTYWSSTEDVKEKLTKVILDDSSEIKAGGMPVISDGHTAYIDEGDGHTVLLGASGMKKSICCFMPLIATLAHANKDEYQNMIITDPKGELYKLASGFLKKRGYNVLCLNFRTMDMDCHNVLGYPATVYKNEDKSRGLSLLSDIINVLAEDARHHMTDPFWPDMASLWMNGTGALMLDAYPKISQINVLNWSEFNVLSSAKALARNILASMPDNIAKASLKQCLTASERTFASILVTASSFMRMFLQNPMLAAMLSTSTFSLDDLLKPKTALFIVSDDSTSTADPIIGVIISQIQSFLIDKAYNSENGRLKVRMNFILDEFASIPIPNMDKALATHRSRNIRYYLCVQSMALLKERYANPEKLLSNCSSTLYMGSVELEMLQELEAKLGTTEITPNGKEKPLCSQSELMTLEKTWNYKEVIYMNLSEGIRYCTKLPSIEAYNVGTYPAADNRRKISEMETYTVEEFINDVLTKKIRAPFVPEEKLPECRTRKRYHYASRPDKKPDLRARIEEIFNFDPIFDDDD